MKTWFCPSRYLMPNGYSKIWLLEKNWQIDNQFQLNLNITVWSLSRFYFSVSEMIFYSILRKMNNSLNDVFANFKFSKIMPNLFSPHGVSIDKILQFI